MIFYLPLPEGEPMSDQPWREPQEYASLVMRHVFDIQLLQPGVKDVTPEIWSKSSPRHELTVLENGEGLHRVLPGQISVGSAEILPPIISSFIRHRLITNINRDHPLLTINGGHPRKHRMQVFGIIGHLSSNRASTQADNLSL
jgi:hypothetical protein